VDCKLVWDLDPAIWEGSLGPFHPELRYYGIIFALTLYIGYLLWLWQMDRGGHPRKISEPYLLWGVAGVILGARLGHCLFYEPEHYLANPLQILAFWKGGLASHGATVGLVVVLILYARKYKLPIVEVLDRFSMPAAVGASAVRLGNFFNSEIVGRVTDLPWGVRFPRYERMTGALPACRHPSQLYEFFFGALVLLILYLADRFAGREKRPRGMLAGLFLTAYFMGRFFIEFVKEYQTDLQQSEFLTMGQYLSVLPFVIGVGTLIWAFTRGRQPASVAEQAESTSRPSVKKKKRKKKKK
jgi:prolipoprotein diacylglyceryl transferase